MPGSGVLKESILLRQPIKRVSLEALVKSATENLVLKIVGRRGVRNDCRDGPENTAGFGCHELCCFPEGLVGLQVELGSEPTSVKRN